MPSIAAGALVAPTQSPSSGDTLGSGSDGLTSALPSSQSSSTAEVANGALQAITATGPVPWPSRSASSYQGVPPRSSDVVASQSSSTPLQSSAAPGWTAVTPSSQS